MTRSLIKQSRGLRKSKPGPPSAFPGLLVFDFDGVLTNNTVIVLQDGNEGVVCSRSDGLAFDLFRAAGISAMILSTETNPVVAARASKLRIQCYQGVSNKAQALNSICKEAGISLKDVLYAGNDLNDFEVMSQVGWPVCPSDAHMRIKQISRNVLRAKGGAGVAREIAERLLRLQYPLKGRLHS